MPRTHILIALFLAASAVAWGQDDIGFTAGSTDLLLAANGGRILSFSSQMLDELKQPVPQWQVANLIDGQHVTGTYRPANSHGWSSQVPPTATNPQWVVFALPGDPVQTRLISRLVIDPTTIESTLIGRSGRDFELYVSATNPDGPWALVKRGQLLNKPLSQTFDFIPVEARYLRLSITSNWGSDRFVQLGEVECYEAIAGDGTLEQLIVRLDNLLQDLKRYRDSVKLNQPIYPELRPAPGTTPTTTAPTTPPGPVAPGPATPTTPAPAGGGG
jgi:hypothetical protein